MASTFRVKHLKYHIVEYEVNSDIDRLLLIRIQEGFDQTISQKKYPPPERVIPLSLTGHIYENQCDLISSKLIGKVSEIIKD
jgi:hypothetical protein